ncbi:MAG: radical SAM protein [Anaerolineae bacterium]|nr:radical SAM protein [Anaerolineae bacterium]
MAKPRFLYLVNPPSPPGALANREGASGLGSLARRTHGFLYPPHLLATLAAAAQGAGWRSRMVDATGAGWDTEETLASIGHEEVPVVVQVSYASHQADGDFLRLLRLERPRAWVLVIGTPSGELAQEWSAEGLADGFLMGEPEGAFVAALACREESEIGILTPEKLKARGYDTNGQLTDLDAVPYPAWEHIDQERYRFLTILSSRGCPDGCLYCPYAAAQGASFRAQSPLRTVEEADWLVRTHRPSRFMFRDPVFARDRARVQAICSGLRARNLRIPWECESRPEHFDAELLREMQAAGCDTIKIGLETTDPALLVALHRVPHLAAAEAYVARVAEVVRQCRNVGIACRVFVMTGLPGQGEEAILTTGQFLRDLHPDASHAKPYRRYPGTGLGEPAEGGEAQAAVLSRITRPPTPLWRRLWRQFAG